MATKYNTRNAAVKRILQELKEVQNDDSAEYIAEAVEDNIFEWHYVIRGPAETEFAGGIYHGRILLPADYPFKPPSFMMLTPNGRFETNTKICLSISSYHPEHWQPSWSMRTALTALIAFLPTHGQGAIGSLDFSKQDRQHLAAKSRSHVPTFGSTDRQQLSKELHDRMVAREAGARHASGEQAAPLNAQQTGDEKAQSSVAASLPSTSTAAAAAAAGGTGQASSSHASSTDLCRQHKSELAQQGASQLQGANSRQLPSAPALAAHSSASAGSLPGAWEDRALTGLAAALLFLIVAIVCRRVLAMSGVDLDAIMFKPT